MTRHSFIMRSAPSTVFLSLAGLLLVACSCDTRAVLAAEKSRTKAARTAASEAKTHTITISGFKFQPDTLTVNAGDTIEWKNADFVPHTATAEDKVFDSGKIGAGASWSFVANKAGTFNYICTLHPNMKAKLVVQ